MVVPESKAQFNAAQSPIDRVFIEAVHRQFRKLIKARGGFPNGSSLLTLLHLDIQNTSKKWTVPIHNWNLMLSRLAIFFEGWFDAALNL